MDSPFNENRGAPGQGSESNSQIKRPDDGKPAEWPRYKLTARAYIDDVMYEPGMEISLDPKTIPSRVMEPLNDAARAQWMAHKERLTRDPLQHLMLAPSEYELKPHQLQALDAMAGSLGFHPMGSKHPAYKAAAK